MKKTMKQIKLLGLAFVPCCVLAAEGVFSPPVLEQKIKNAKRGALDFRVRGMCTPSIGWDKEQPGLKKVSCPEVPAFAEVILGKGFGPGLIVGQVAIGNAFGESLAGFHINPRIGYRFFGKDAQWMGGTHLGANLGFKEMRPLLQGLFGVEGRFQEYGVVRMNFHFPVGFCSGQDTADTEARSAFANFFELSGEPRWPGFPYMAGDFSISVSMSGDWVIQKPGMRQAALSAVDAGGSVDGYVGLLVKPLPLVNVGVGYQVGSKTVAVKAAFSYRFDMPLKQQIKMARVKYTNTIAGSQLEFVEAKNRLFVSHKPSAAQLAHRQPKAVTEEAKNEVPAE